MRRAIDSLNGPLTMWLGGTLLVVASALFVAAEVSINAVNGWWADELYSLWASDLSLPFIHAFAERIAPDANPPLYYTVLYWVRWLITDDRTAVLAINIAAMVIAAVAVFVASQRVGLGGLGLASLAMFISSGPVLYYASEGRSYCLAMTVVFVASWYTALAIKDPHQRPALASFVGLGAIAALTHVYAALLCGALGAGLLMLVLFSARRNLFGPGLALALSSTVVFVIWFSMSWHLFPKISWIEYTPGSVFHSAWYVIYLAVGGLLIFPFLFLMSLLFFGMFDRTTRPFFISFGIAFALFVLIPIIASFKQPIIVGRYWLIGAPALITLMIFAAWTWFLSGVSLSEKKVIRLVAACCALFFLVASNIHGFVAARTLVYRKEIWKGAKIVRPLLDHCPARAIHVATGNPGGHPTLVWAFSKMTQASPSLFVDAKLPSTPSISPAMTPCPVLGWAEHIWRQDFMRQATDADLLRFLKIKASPDEVDVRRTSSANAFALGVVILKRAPSRESHRANHAFQH